LANGRGIPARGWRTLVPSSWPDSGSANSRECDPEVGCGGAALGMRINAERHLCSRMLHCYCWTATRSLSRDFQEPDVELDDNLSSERPSLRPVAAALADRCPMVAATLPYTDPDCIPVAFRVSGLLPLGQDLPSSRMGLFSWTMRDSDPPPSRPRPHSKIKSVSPNRSRQHPPHGSGEILVPRHSAWLAPFSC